MLMRSDDIALNEEKIDTAEELRASWVPFTLHVLTLKGLLMCFVLCGGRLSMDIKMKNVNLKLFLAHTSSIPIYDFTTQAKSASIK